jgi:gamma-glutamylcyclotransferase (GGCT)/AIG2-like uncharacterized protein YtfP
VSAAVHVFAYGTLTFPQVMERVTGRLFESTPAILQGYARSHLRGETFPGLIEEATSATDGLLWLDLDAESLSTIEGFEGDWYERRAVQVVVGEQPRDAVTFVLKREQRHRVSRRRWIRSRFEQRYLQRFLLDCSNGPKAGG